MHLSTLLTTGLLSLFAMIGQAQSTLTNMVNTANTVNAAAYTANNMNSAVSNTSSAIKGTANTVKELTTLFKKKEKPAVEIAAQPIPVGNAVLMTISGVDYSNLKKLEDSLKEIKGVKDTQKKFNATASTIAVTYEGKDDELWDALPEATKASFDLTELGEGKISLAKKK